MIHSQALSSAALVTWKAGVPCLDVTQPGFLSCCSSYLKSRSPLFRWYTARLSRLLLRSQDRNRMKCSSGVTHTCSWKDCSSLLFSNGISRENEQDYSNLWFKGTQAWDNFEFFFLPKSNPYIPFVNFRKKIRFFSFDFHQNFDVRTFPRWLSIRGTKFFWEISKQFFFQNLHFGPIR